MKDKQIVVLLHGIGHSRLHMVFIERALQKAGFITLNLSYPSRRYDIKALAGWLDTRLTEKDTWEKSDQVHFVAHSMGGLVTGTYLTNFRNKIPESKMGRVVMLGTPHGGSEVADFLRNNPLYKHVFGPAGQELTTIARKENQIQPWYELGIIAGSHNWTYPFGLFCIKEENDGCVSISSSKLKGMNDHITISVPHGFLSWNKSVLLHTLNFIEKGQFIHE